MELLVAIAIIGLMVAILLPAIQAARESARRTSCIKNLKQIGLAMLQFDDRQKRLPHAEMLKAPNSPSTNGASAFVPLLPYLEEQPRYEQLDLRKSIASDQNQRIVKVQIPVFCCPSMSFLGPEPEPGWASYAICTGSGNSHFAYQFTDPKYHNGAIVAPLERVSPSSSAIKRIRVVSLAKLSVWDGTSCTFLAGDMDYGLANINAVGGSFNTIEPGGSTSWWDAYPVNSMGSTVGVFNADRIYTPFQEWVTFRSDHPRGVNMLMADGSVHFIEENISPDVLDNLAARNDGMHVENF